MKIAIKTRETGTRDEDSYGDGPYDYSWSEDNYFEVVSVTKVADNKKWVKYGVDNFLVNDSDTVYVVVLRYSSGDSFGSSTGNGTLVHAFSDKSKAEFLKESLETSGEEEYTIEFIDDLDREVKYHNPAAGYFESIDSVSIEVFKV